MAKVFYDQWRREVFTVFERERNVMLDALSVHVV